MNPANDFERVLSDELAGLSARHLSRRRRAVRPLGAAHVEIDGRRLVNFASNDYLGLTHHKAILAAVIASVSDHGWGSGAAPLVSGYTDLHAKAESALAAWKNTEDALLLPSGFQANFAAIHSIAAVTASSGRSVRFLLDKLAHASLVDAVRSSGAPFRIFPHNGMTKLRRLLHEAPPSELQVVVTESIFSMDGDAADLPALAELKQQRPFFLLLDEAHASGVYGPSGVGYAAELGLSTIVDLSVITLSKALGGVGGAICASENLCNAVVNVGRPYLFSTSLPPAVAAGAIAALEVLRTEPSRQKRVRDLARRVRSELHDAGLKIPTGDSPIIPVILESEEAALSAAQTLRDQGLLAVAIRPPTVPRGGSRLRITLSSEHTEAQVVQLVEVLGRLAGFVK